ncbi:ABC transporter permease [Peribacillus sp. NPDC096540]|uniref:ABC transporter permease n=1 Tax=Peribacillus sp. NPDC096540 TaxID=3390612 RepID=UPI003D043379
MRKIWNICSWEIQRIFKKPQSYLIMFAMPLLFTMLFGTLLGDGEKNKPAIVLVDEDDTILSKSLFEELHKDNSLFKLEKGTNQQALHELEEKKIVGVIHIQKGFETEMAEGEVPKINFQHIPEFTSNQAITGLLSNKLSKLNIETTAAFAWSEQTGEAWQVMYEKLKLNSILENTELKKVITDEGNVSEQSGLSGSAAGFSIMFLMITMMSVTGTILEARNNGVWYRLISTPASRFEIAAGYLLSFFLIGWIQFGILIVATTLFFDVKWGNPFSLMIFVSVMLFAIVGLGLMIAGLAKTVEQQSAAGSLIVVSTSMIAGVYWPLEIEPVFMQKMANFLPQTWAMKGLKDIAGNGVLPFESIAILLVFALVFLFIGMRKIKFE